MYQFILFSFILLQDNNLDNNISHDDKSDNNVDVGGSKIVVEQVSFFLFYCFQKILFFFYVFPYLFYFNYNINFLFQFKDTDCSNGIDLSNSNNNIVIGYVNNMAREKVSLFYIK